MPRKSSGSRSGPIIINHETVSMCEFSVQLGLTFDQYPFDVTWDFPSGHKKRELKGSVNGELVGIYLFWGGVQDTINAVKKSIVVSLFGIIHFGRKEKTTSSHDFTVGIIDSALYRTLISLEDNSGPTVQGDYINGQLFKVNKRRSNRRNFQVLDFPNLDHFVL